VTIAELIAELKTWPDNATIEFSVMGAAGRIELLSDPQVIFGPTGNPKLVCITFGRPEKS
jgi:hypothetical protein